MAKAKNAKKEITGKPEVVAALKRLEQSGAHVGEDKDTIAHHIVELEAALEEETIGHEEDVARYEEIIREDGERHAKEIGELKGKLEIATVKLAKVLSITS